MKFQLALDYIDVQEAMAMADLLHDCVQVFEIGTPLVLKEGSRATQAVHERYPNHQVLMDSKIMDAGGPEAKIAFDAGAAYVTVCGCANDATIQNAIAQAKKDGRGVMIDMIEVKNLEARLAELDGLGAAYIQIHTSFDGRGVRTPLEELELAKKVLQKTPCAVAGGVGPDNIAGIAALCPDLIVIGSKITTAQDPRKEMEKVLKVCEERR